MRVDDPEQWRWIWMVAAVGFLVREMASPGSFFLLPFAVMSFIASRNVLEPSPSVMRPFASITVTSPT